MSPLHPPERRIERVAEEAGTGNSRPSERFGGLRPLAVNTAESHRLMIMSNHSLPDCARRTKPAPRLGDPGSQRRAPLPDAHRREASAHCAARAGTAEEAPRWLRVRTGSQSRTRREFSRPNPPVEAFVAGSELARTLLEDGTRSAVGGCQADGVVARVDNVLSVERWARSTSSEGHLLEPPSSVQPRPGYTGVDA